MQIKLEEGFLVWHRITNPHLYLKSVKAADRKKELTEYVSDVLQEHIESMNSLMNDDSPDSGFEGQA